MGSISWLVWAVTGAGTGVGNDSSPPMAWMAVSVSAVVSWRLRKTWFSGIYRGMKLSYYQSVTSTY